MALQGFMDFAGLSPQLDTLQLPKQTNLTLQKTSDSSFSQILSSFYKDDASFKKDEPIYCFSLISTKVLMLFISV